MSITALYPGTFDPITNGHIDIVSRAVKLFDRLIVAVAENPGKQPLFDLEQRIALSKTALAEYPQVAVIALHGLTVATARQHDALLLLRGVRSASDFTAECSMAMMNKQLDAELETVLIPADPKYAAISSTLLKDIASHGGDITAFTHPAVAAALTEKIANA